MRQAGEAAQAWELTFQRFALEIQVINASVTVRSDTAPAIERLVTEPVVIVRPIGAVGRVVEGYEYCSVRV